MQYIEFKRVCQQTVDGILSRYRPIPPELAYAAQKFKYSGTQNLAVHIRRYNDGIAHLSVLRKRVSARTSYGWFWYTQAKMKRDLSYHANLVQATGMLILIICRGIRIYNDDDSHDWPGFMAQMNVYISPSRYTYSHTDYLDYR